MTENKMVGRSKAVAYARASVAPGEMKDSALRAQLFHARRYAEQRGLVLTREYVDTGTSGVDEGRPELGRLLEDLQRPDSEIGFIVVRDASRLTRNAAQTALLRELAQHGIQVLVAQPASPATASDR